ncbi:MAG TPA: hypothetical protein VGJ87_14035 [Roseiflexaceae bacterium]
MSQREDTVLPVEDKPLLADIIVRNIANLSRLRQQSSQRRTLQEHLSDTITSFSGHMLFVYLHILWYATIRAANRFCVAHFPYTVR